MGDKKAHIKATTAGLVAHLREAGHQVHLIADGIIHIGSAPDDLRIDFVREATTCVTETVIVIVEDVLMPEVTLCIDAFVTAEKVAATPAAQRNGVKIFVETAAGLASGVIAATQCFTHAVHDLEKIGSLWEQAHPRHNKPDREPA